MKKLFDVLVLTLALNFLAIAGSVGWLYQAGHLDRSRVTAIKEVLFPKPAPTEMATTQPSDAAPATRPTLKLEELLASKSGMSATEQVEFIQHAFDAQMALLDRRAREIKALEEQANKAQAAAEESRRKAEDAAARLAADKQATAKLATDKGFQDSLELYRTMPAKQVKTIFMGLDDAVVRQYLGAMEPRQAQRIIKEFKSADEIDRIKKIMESMRLAGLQANVKE